VNGKGAKGLGSAPDERQDRVALPIVQIDC
jgi:hypothetical protein